MERKENPIVYLDIKVGKERAERVVLELYANIASKTAENFRALCTGEKGTGQLGKPLCYKGTIFHKAVPNFMIQGGDITNFDGTGGESIYGLNFEDETFKVKHDAAGILSMANAGANSNSSQFFITTDPCPHLDNTNVAFGKVRKGYGAVLAISHQESVKDRPIKKCEVINCGELKEGDNWGVVKRDGTEDFFPSFPDDWEVDNKSLETNTLQDTVTMIKESGNYFYSRRNYDVAEYKYRKALRYVTWIQALENKPHDYNEEKISNMMVNCLLNLAAVSLKLKAYREALESCNKAIGINTSSAKAFYRRGQASAGLNDYQAALQDLGTAQELEPTDKSIGIQIDSIKKVMERYKKIEKSTFAKMLRNQ